MAPRQLLVLGQFSIGSPSQSFFIFPVPSVSDDSVEAIKAEFPTKFVRRLLISVIVWPSISAMDVG